MNTTMVQSCNRKVSKVSENWLTLKSLQGIKNGQGNGLFKTYGEENVGRALQTIKRLCNEVTKETVIGATL